MIGTLSEERTETPAAHACLVVIYGPELGKRAPLGAGSFEIGRSSKSDLPIDQESISRHHARITFDGRQHVIEDLGSTNGTFVGDRPVERHTLADGDRIGLGRTTVLKFTLQDELEESFQRQMYESAVRDPLTRVFNRKYFMDRLRTELSFASRERKSPSNFANQTPCLGSSKPSST